MAFSIVTLALVYFCVQTIWCKTVPPSTVTTVTFITKSCLTEAGTRRVIPVPTTTHLTTTHQSMTVNSTITPTTTYYPNTTTVTTTISTTSTLTVTASTPTDTSTTTTTSTTALLTTTTTTSVITTSSVITVTTPISTTTIMEPAGFTPVAVQYPPGTAAAEQAHVRPAGKLALTRSRSVYATSVICAKTVSFVTMTYSTITGIPSTITAPTPTTTVSTTTTIVTTSTFNPAHVTTTITTTVTSTVTSTLTETTTSVTTTTSTTTSYTAAQTTYAVCEDDTNYLTYYNGNNIGTGTSIYGNTMSYFDFPSAYDCCVACQQQSACGASLYTTAAWVPFCYLFSNNGTCDATQEVGLFYTDSDYMDTTISNGDCGTWGYGGGSR